MARPARPVVRIRIEVKVDSVLDRLVVGHGHEADANRRGLIGADDDFPLTLGQDPPIEHLGPETCEARKIVCVNDDVVE